MVCTVKTPCKYCNCEKEYWDKHSLKWHCWDCGRYKDYVADAEILDKISEL